MVQIRSLQPNTRGTRWSPVYRSLIRDCIRIQTGKPVKSRHMNWETTEMNLLATILVIILILALVGAFPAWPYSANWGYGPTGGVGTILIILLILVLLGKI